MRPLEKQVISNSGRTRLTVARFLKVRYSAGGNEDQPRVPTGTPEGGQFASQATEGVHARDAANVLTGLRRSTNHENALDNAKQFVNQPLTNSDSGITATVSGESLSKILSWSCVKKSINPQAHFLAVANLETLFRVSIHRDSRPDNRGLESVEQIHHFSVPMPFEGELLEVRIMAKEFRQKEHGTRLYHVRAIQIEKPASFEGASNSTELNQIPTSPAGFQPKFDTLCDAVKVAIEKSSDRDTDHDRPSDDEVNKNSRDAAKVMRYSRIDAAVARFAMHYAKPAPAKGQQEFRWITIHPHGHAEGTGTPVKIDGQGNIVGGPKALADKGIKKLSDFAKKSPDDSETATPEPVTAASGRKFVPHPAGLDDPDEPHDVVMVDPKKLDAAWQKDTPGYIGAKDHPNEIAGRRERAAEFITTGTPIQASKVRLQNGGIVSFADGRHRFVAMRDAGDNEVAVTVPKHQAAEFQKLFGDSKPKEQPSAPLRQVGLFSQSDLGGAPQLFDTGKEFVREKKSTTKPVEAAPSTLEKIDDELKAKVREAQPLAGQQNLLGDSSQSAWDNLPRPAIDGFEKNVLARLRDQVKQLNDIKSRLGQRYAWEVATKRGEKPGDPHVASAAVERWKQHAKSVGLDADSLVASHPEYQAILQDLDQHRAWGSTPVKKYSRVAIAAARYARETRPIPTPNTRDDHNPEPAPTTTVNGGKKPTGGKNSGGQWITVGGSPVHIDDDGKILLGCPGLKGEHVDDLQDEPDESRRIREVRQAHAEARGLTGRDVTAGEAKRLASPNKIKQHAAAKEAARGTGHSTANVLRAMSDAHAMHADQHTVLRPAINRAMKLTGLTPALARDWENSYRDWSTWPDFDHFARAVVAEHPELGLDRDDHDTPAKLWDLIRNQGKRTAKDELHSPDVARTAVEMLGRPTRGKRRPAPATEDASNAFDAFDAGDAADDGDGDTSFDPDKFHRAGRVDRVALASGRFTLLNC